MKKQANAAIKGHIIRYAPYLLLLAAGTVMAFFVPQVPTKALHPAELTFAERVSYQRAIEKVYWRHRIWPKENPKPKPPLEAMMSQAELEKKVEDYLAESEALEGKNHEPLSAGQLQAEMERMASHSKQPEVLRELFQALGDDPYVIAECLARPALAERMTSALGLTQSKTGWSKPELQVIAAATANYTLPKIATGGDGCTDDTWISTSLNNAPSGRDGHTAVWTGTEMIIWGGAIVNNINFNTGGRYNPSTDSWIPTSTVNAPQARVGHSAIWTGTEMIIWGGLTCCPEVFFSNGARYNPTTDTWIATAKAPEGRTGHSTIWTGTKMIVWGGYNLVSFPLNTGASYDPNTDSWKIPSTTDAPSARYGHTAVWTGSEMIVWGGTNGSGEVYFNTGAKYNPLTDTWLATSTSTAPSGRIGQAAAWSGREMVIWGGGGNVTNTSGGRYDPFTDSWTATSTINAPSARFNFAEVWTGSEMIVWGGSFSDGTNNRYLNTGGRYNPFTDSWTATSLVNAPSPRNSLSAVWTGSEMIVWGGFFFDNDFHFLNTGGKYCAEVGPTPTPTPPPIILHGQGKKVQGINTVRLNWSGATSTKVDVYRNGGVIVTVVNNGSYVDNTGDGNQTTYTYMICEAGSQTCSSDVTVSFAQSINATWSSNPVSGDWNDPLNWTPNTVPNGPFAIATFNTSTITDISISGKIAVRNIVFNPGANAFTITVPATKTLTLTGAGVINNSAQKQNFVTSGTLTLQGNATAGSNAVYTNNGTINFHEFSNAGNSMFVFSGGTSQARGASGEFRDSANAAHATFILEAGTVAGAPGADLSFFDGPAVSAGNATIIVNGGAISRAEGAEVDFFAIQPSEPTLILNGGTNGGTGAELMFFSGIPDNLAHVQLNGDAFMDMSIAGNVTVGSLAGEGTVDLGDFILTVGGNNQNTVFTGLLDQINTEGYDAGLKKVGTGTLTLSHDNMFKGGVTIIGGALSMDNQSGSASGSDGVVALGGILAGGGITAGAVQIGTGSGDGAFLGPGQGASQPKTLTTQQTVTFKVDGTYIWKFNPNLATADQVIANGVTIDSGAQFDFQATANKKLAAGTVFTAISNTSSTAISGTFSNLADGSTVTVGVNTFQASYSGGDGNDLTLTVVQ